MYCCYHANLHGFGLITAIRISHKSCVCIFVKVLQILWPYWSRGIILLKKTDKKKSVAKLFSSKPLSKLFFMALTNGHSFAI